MSRSHGHIAVTVPPERRTGIGPLGAAEDGSSGRLLSLRAAADYLGLSYWTVRDLVNAGTIRSVRLPLGAGRDLRRVLLDRRDLDALVEQSKG
jgi:excisionase family DNA binding protein